jgi:DnaK suppressor protein
MSKKDQKKAAKSKVLTKAMSRKGVAKIRSRSKPQTGKSQASKSQAQAKTKSAAKTKAVGKARDRKLTSRATTSTIVLPPNYRPSEDEPFMNERHRAYFRQKLLTWKEEIIRQTRETLAGLHEDSTQHADLADRATSETDRALELRARDRQRKLIAKIGAALSRIEDGTYGYCEETGEPIGLKRLDARPIATLSLEAQERHERRERVYRED